MIRTHNSAPFAAEVKEIYNKLAAPIRWSHGGALE